MLEKVGFKNFLALRNVELTLEPFTVIVGPNASGKSSILEGIKRICNSEEDIFKSLLNLDIKSVKLTPTEDVSEPEDLLSPFIDESISRIISKTYTTKELIFSCSFSSKKYNFKFAGYENKIWRLICNQHEVYLLELNRVDSIEISQKKINFSLQKASLASYSENLKPFLEESGAGLATVCSYLQSVKPEKFIWIQEQMKKIVPNYLKFRIEPAKVAARDWFNITDQNKYLEDIISRRSATGQQLIFDFVNASDIAVEFVSEGTLFALTVLVAIASSEGETVLLIDDLERGLHPSAVREMIKALRDIQKITPELQIIATSHSPYILDKLEPREVRVVAFDPELGTMVASLEEYPNFDNWREAMTPGEFWSFVGEDWVKELYAGRARV